MQEELQEDVQEELQEDVQEELQEDVQEELREDVQEEPKGLAVSRGLTVRSAPLTRCSVIQHVSETQQKKRYTSAEGFLFRSHRLFAEDPRLFFLLYF